MTTTSKAEADAKLEAIQAAKDFVFGYKEEIEEKIKSGHIYVSPHTKYIFDVQVKEDFLWNDNIHDVAMIIKASFSTIKEGCYLFDIVDFPFIMTTPEFIEMAMKKLFFIIGNKLVLKEKYRDYSKNVFYTFNDEPVETKNSNGPLGPTYGLKEGINLVEHNFNELLITDRYVKLLMKVHKNKQVINHWVKNYVILSTETHETMYQRIDNTVYTGRAGRVLISSSSGNRTGSNFQDEAIKAMNQFTCLDGNSQDEAIRAINNFPRLNRNFQDEAIKAINNFARLGKGKKLCMARVHRGKGLWETVIQD